MEIKDIYKAVKEGNTGIKTTAGVIKEAAVAKARNGKQYMRVILQDRTGEISYMKWEANSYDIENLSTGKVVQLIGVEVNVFNDKVSLQSTTQSYKVLPDSERPKYQQTTAPEEKALRDRLDAVLKLVQNTHIKKACDALMDEKVFNERFYVWPAAKSIHHAEKNGLLFHTVRMMEAGVKLCEVYTGANRDLVIAGILFHDYGKIFEMTKTDAWVGEYTPDALLGHIFIGAAKLNSYMEAGILTYEEYRQLAHVVLAHHGQNEWGSPVTPMTPEAMIVHSVDNLDARINAMEWAALTTPAGELSRNGFYNPLPLTLVDEADNAPAETTPAKEPSEE